MAWWIKHLTAVAWVSAEAWVQSSAWQIGLRIQHCHNSSLDSVPGPETSICCRCVDLKKKKKSLHQEWRAEGLGTLEGGPVLIFLSCVIC